MNLKLRFVLFITLVMNLTALHSQRGKDGNFTVTLPNTNLNSLFNVTKQVIDGMVEKGWGRVVNISSVNGQKGQFGQTNYATAKAGLRGRQASCRCPWLI